MNFLKIVKTSPITKTGYFFVGRPMDDCNTSWYEIREDEVYDGMMIFNMNFGYCYYTAKSMVILEKAKAESFKELDWTNTSCNDRCSTDGWLTPDGIFYGCSTFQHSYSCHYNFDLSESEVEELGYVKISDGHVHLGFAKKMGERFYSCVHPTNKQSEFLMSHNYKFYIPK